MTRRIAARENLELTGFEFKHDGARDSSLLARNQPELLGKPPDHGLGFS